MYTQPAPGSARAGGETIVSGFKEPRRKVAPRFPSRPHEHGKTCLSFRLFYGHASARDKRRFLGQTDHSRKGGKGRKGLCWIGYLFLLEYLPPMGGRKVCTTPVGCVKELNSFFVALSLSFEGCRVWLGKRFPFDFSVSILGSQVLFALGEGGNV